VETAPSDIPVTQELNLNSLPGAPATLFLDFNGHFDAERNWDMPAYSRDDDATHFSPAEQYEIRTLWSSVAEDYAPFNINVTTVDPDPNLLNTNGNYLRVVMSGGGDPREGINKGGAGPQGAFADDQTNIAFAFLMDKELPVDDPNRLRSVRYMAEVVSHEAGHTFGLDHIPLIITDHRTDPPTVIVEEYYSGDSLRAPIMGDSSLAQRGIWWDGINIDGVRQDDMAVIASDANGFGFRPDDHGNDLGNASPLRLDSRAGLHASGVIETTDDVDTFRFQTGGGFVSIFVSTVGNLHAVVRLFDAQGKLVPEAEYDPPDKLNPSVFATVGAGPYFIKVSSYGEYGDVGQYSLKVSEKTGARIVSSQLSPVGSTEFASLVVTFNEPINPLTFTTVDVRINGGAAGAGVTQVASLDQFSFVITFVKPTNTTGAYWSVAIGPDINDFFGNKMDQNANGINGEAADYYWASFLAEGTLDPTGSTNPLKTRTPRVLSSMLADAVYGDYR
jgi:hypothetical protein